MFLEYAKHMCKLIHVYTSSHFVYAISLHLKISIHILLSTVAIFVFDFFYADVRVYTVQKMLIFFNTPTTQFQRSEKGGRWIR